MSGLLQSGSGLPRRMIFSRFVLSPAATAAEMLIRGCMVNGVWWCSLNITPSIHGLGVLELDQALLVKAGGLARIEPAIGKRERIHAVAARAGFVHGVAVERFLR